MDISDSPRVCTYYLGCIMGIYYILWVPLTVDMWAVLGLREYSILMHIYPVRCMRAKLSELMQ